MRLLDEDLPRLQRFADETARGDVAYVLEESMYGLTQFLFGGTRGWCVALNRAGQPSLLPIPTSDGFDPFLEV